MEENKTIQKQLFSLQDVQYRAFHCRLIPNVDHNTVIGVRVPELRKLAKTFAAEPEAKVFLQTLPHTYYEENNLHGLLIERMGSYPQVIEALQAFLPYVDNWATCDMIRPKVFSQHRQALLDQIRIWMASDHTYTVRFGMEMLMTHFLEETFQPVYLQWVAEIRSEEYYVNMMAAWFFATALAKQYEAAVSYLENHRLSPWVHKKSIQKAIESNRISPAQKAYLRSLT